MGECISQSKPRSDDLAAKKDTTEMKGEVVVLHACLPPRDPPEKELLVFSMIISGGYTDTARFSVKEVLLGSYEESFIELTRSGGEFYPPPLWRPGEYVLFFEKPKCKEARIVQIRPCDVCYVDAGKPNPNGSATVCVGKVCDPHQYSEALSSMLLRDTGEIPYIVDPKAIEYFEKQWDLQVVPFERKGFSVSRGISLKSLSKCLKAGKCLPTGKRTP